MWKKGLISGSTEVGKEPADNVRSSSPLPLPPSPFLPPSVLGFRRDRVEGMRQKAPQPRARPSVNIDIPHGVSETQLVHYIRM